MRVLLPLLPRSLDQNNPTKPTLAPQALGGIFFLSLILCFFLLRVAGFRPSTALPRQEWVWKYPAFAKISQTPFLWEECATQSLSCWSLALLHQIYTRQGFYFIFFFSPVLFIPICSIIILWGLFHSCCRIRDGLDISKSVSP